jgi:uncharacterized membrane protein
MRARERTAEFAPTGVELARPEDSTTGLVAPGRAEKENRMLYTVAVVLIVLWLLGLVSSYTMGGFIHILLVIAIIVVLLNIIQGRKIL